MTPAPAHWEHFNPVRIVAGAGSLRELAGLLPAGATILLVTTPGFSRRGVTARIRDILSSQDADCRLVVHDAVAPNPELDDLDQSAGRLRELAPAAIVALGGGSALDAGKVFSAILDARVERPLHRVFREGAAAAWSARTPLVAIPTTAGTGSEVTPFATVWDRQTRLKFSVAGESVYPTACILDPELTLSLGSDDTLYPALDAISHSLESLWNRHATPVSAALSLEALRIAAQALPKVLANGADLQARAGMQHASLLAGMAIARTRTALAHSISYPLTLHHGVPHGLACSFTLAALLRRHAAELAKDASQHALLVQVADLLDGLRLHEHLRRFATPEQVVALLPQMHTPGRADNFLFAADTEVIVRASLAPSGAAG